MKRSANAIWKGNLKEGNGHISSKSTAINNVQYSFSSRFEEGVGTNPEELIAAAHAGCFSMAFSAELGKEGITPESIETSAFITFENGVLSESHLVVKATVPGSNKETVENCANIAKENCPISKVLNLKKTMELSIV
jgi:lipoyl-dependent peroxiredoxin